MVAVISKGRLKTIINNNILMFPIDLLHEQLGRIKRQETKSIGQAS